MMKTRTYKYSCPQDSSVRDLEICQRELSKSQKPAREMGGKSGWLRGEQQHKGTYEGGSCRWALREAGGGDPW